jgi:hypothetical protein
MRLLINKLSKEVFLFINDALTEKGASASIIQSLTNPDSKLLIIGSAKIESDYTEMSGVKLAKLTEI